MLNYGQVHALVREIRGHASKYACVSCGNPAAEWALRPELTAFGKGRFSQDIYDYQAMCHLCHARMDSAGHPKPTSGGPGIPKKPEHRAKLAVHLRSDRMRENARTIGKRPKQTFINAGSAKDSCVTSVSASHAERLPHPEPWAYISRAPAT